jgi:hypothetical protein
MLEEVAMSATTEPLDLGRARDLQGRENHPWFRRAGLAILALLLLAALFGKLGQPQVARAAATPAGSLRLVAPKTLRGGLLWRAQITVTAKTRIIAPQLVLANGWAKGMQFNTMEPAASSESGRGTALVFNYSTLAPGQRFTVYAQLQVNPTTVGRQDLSIALEGHGITPIRLPASVLVLP